MKQNTHNFLDKLTLIIVVIIFFIMVVHSIQKINNEKYNKCYDDIVRLDGGLYTKIEDYQGERKHQEELLKEALNDTREYDIFSSDSGLFNNLTNKEIAQNMEIGVFNVPNSPYGIFCGEPYEYDRFGDFDKKGKLIIYPEWNPIEIENNLKIVKCVFWEYEQSDELINEYLYLGRER